MPLLPGVPSDCRSTLKGINGTLAAASDSGPIIAPLYGDDGWVFNPVHLASGRLPWRREQRLPKKPDSSSGIPCGCANNPLNYVTLMRGGAAW